MAALLNPRLDSLFDYPFERLRVLLGPLSPPPDVTPLSLAPGDPQHQPPAFIADVLAQEASHWNGYPPLRGTDRFRDACHGWIGRRFGAAARAAVDGERGILPVSGTREALFLAALLAVPEHKDGRRPAVLIPNPFYAAYEGAAVMAGGEPVFLPATADTGFLPDLDAVPDALWARTALVYLCTPTNPQGAVASPGYLRRAIGLARRHGFVLALDECYSEIYFTADPPPGGLAVAAGMDGGTLDNLLVFQSLSKRSSAAGLRAGFVAGPPGLIDAFARLRGYAAASMPLPIQAAAAALYDDDAHVRENRDRYAAKVAAVGRTLGDRVPHRRPQAGFFLWLDLAPLGLDGEAAAERLWTQAGLRVLPGRYLTRPGADGRNAGDPFIRIALIHDTETVAEAMTRLADTLAPARAAV